jgi:hypothetical protein
MYEYRRVGTINRDMDPLNELGAEGWRVLLHIPDQGSMDHFLLERERLDAPSEEALSELTELRESVEILNRLITPHASWMLAVQKAGRACQPNAGQLDIAQVWSLLELVAKGPVVPKEPIYPLKEERIIITGRDT